MNTGIETLNKLFSHTTVPTEEMRGDTVHLQLLYCFARMLKPKVCVEIGSQRGYSAAWTAQALEDNQHGHLWCIDPFIGCGEGKESVFQATINNMGLRYRIILEEGYSQDPEVLENIPKEIDFLLIDGAHSKEACVLDTKNYVPRLTSGGIAFFHDYRSCPGVKEAIHEAKELEGFFKFPLPTMNHWMYAAIKP